jgi:hypothetical protein
MKAEVPRPEVRGLKQGDIFLFLPLERGGLYPMRPPVSSFILHPSHFFGQKSRNKAFDF